MAVTELYGTTMSGTASPTNVILGNSATITAIVDTTNPASNAALKPTGTFTFNGISNPVTVTAAQDASGNWELQGTVTFTPQYNTWVNVNYTGDSNYAASSASLFVNVTIPDFSVSAGAAPLAVTAGQTGTETLTITPATNYTSTVQLTCATFTIPGGTCAISPSSVTLSNGTAATATLTITTTAPSSTTSARTTPIGQQWPVPPFSRIDWWSVSLLTGLAALFLTLLPGRRNSRQAAWGFGMACVLSFVMGCGGGASANNGGGNPGPFATTTLLTASSTKVQQNSTVTLTATVTAASGGTPTGIVTFGSPDCYFGGSVALTGGQAQTQSSFPVGTCAVNAQYIGSGTDLNSKSGALDIATTGSTTVVVEGLTGQDAHQIQVNVTIQ